MDEEQKREGRISKTNEPRADVKGEEEGVEEKGREGERERENESTRER